MPNTAKISGKKSTPLSKAELAKLNEIAPFLKKIIPTRISTEAECERAIELLHHLLIQSRFEEDHPLEIFIHSLALVIGEYESKHPVMEDASQAEMLTYLMDIKNLRQVDLKDIISQGNLSAVLNGKRQLTATHIEKLSQRFNVSPAVFFPLHPERATSA